MVDIREDIVTGFFMSPICISNVSCKTYMLAPPYLKKKDPKLQSCVGRELLCFDLLRYTCRNIF